MTTDANANGDAWVARYELDNALAQRDEAVKQLSAVSAGVGFAEGVLTNVADRLGYLQELWGKEAITDRMVGAIREALARLEKLHDITNTVEANADANE